MLQGWQIALDSCISMHHQDMSYHTWCSARFKLDQACSENQTPGVDYCCILSPVIHFFGCYVMFAPIADMLLVSACNGSAVLHWHLLQ